MKKQTTVMVDTEKWEMAKSKGYKLQDLVDTALNNVLSINGYSTTTLQEEKDETLEEIKLMEHNKEKAIQKWDKRIKELEYKLTVIEEKIQKNREHDQKLQYNHDRKIEWLKERNIMFDNVRTIIKSLVADNKAPEENSEVQLFMEKYDLKSEDLTKIYHFPEEIDEVIPYINDE
jgi:small-conductance mechanosensitive channel